MKRKIVVMMLAAALAATLIGCGSKTSDSSSQTETAESKTTSESTDDSASKNAADTESGTDEAVVVKPQQPEVDLDNIEDGIYHVCFSGDAVVDKDGQLCLENVEIYTEDNYDIVDMHQLKAGDSIVINDKEMLVETVEEKDGVIYVNGGLENDGAEFTTMEDTNGWRYFGYNDESSYSSHGTGTFKISENVVYTDNANLDNKVNGGYDDLADAISQGAEYAGYTQYNTTVRFENGEIVEITRNYTP